MLQQEDYTYAYNAGNTHTSVYDSEGTGSGSRIEKQWLGCCTGAIAMAKQEGPKADI